MATEWAAAQIGGSGAPAPRLPVTFRDQPGRLRATTHDRRLPLSRMLLRVPDGCSADRRLILALRPECSISRTTALARHDAGLSVDWASPVTWIWRAAQGAPRLAGQPPGRRPAGTAETAAPRQLHARQAPDRPRATTASCWPLPARPASRLRWCVSHADAPRRSTTPCARGQRTDHALADPRSDRHDVRAPVRIGTGIRSARAAGRTWPR